MISLSLRQRGEGRGEGPIRHDLLLLLTLLQLAACTGPTERSPLERTGTVEGEITTTAPGDAWLFLYRPGEGPPGAPATPLAATAVSADRMRTDPRYVMAQVKPNAWRLTGLIDVDGDFDATIDVLSQVTAGDRTSKGVPFQAQPGRGANVPIEIDTPVFTEPPAFSFEGESDHDVTLDPALDAITPLTLVADPVGRFDPKKVAFTFGLLDTNADQRPDDADGDGTPDLSLQLFLRWRPLPGQVAEGTTVIVPLAFDPSPFLLTLENRLDTTVTAKRLQVVMVPQAVALDSTSDAGVRPFGAPPPGDYELVALTAQGQFWRLPNQLGASLPSQGARLHIDRLIR